MIGSGRIVAKIRFGQPGHGGVGVRVRRSNISGRQRGPGAARQCPDGGLRLQPLLQPLPPELITHVLERVNRPASGIRQAQASLNRAQMDGRSHIARRITDRGVRPDRSFRGKQITGTTYGLLRISRSHGITVPEKPMRGELDEGIGQFRLARRIGTDPAAKPLYQGAQRLATLSIEIWRLVS